MKLIVGLGNIGEKYENTRHNLGFMVVDKFLQECTSVNDTRWEESKKFQSFIAECSWKPRSLRFHSDDASSSERAGQAKNGEEEKLILAKPTTHMNGSGVAVAALAKFYKIEPSDIWIVHDELDLPLGSMKIRNGGSSAGHHGIESVMEKLGTEKFWRFRLGIGMSKNHSEVGGHIHRNVDEYVLGAFSRGEGGKVKLLIKRGSDALKAALEKDLQSAMHRFNTK